MTNLQRIKNILLSPNSWEAVVNDQEFFKDTIAEMSGVPHVNYHAEGGVLDHVKLAFAEMLKIPDHDWFDLLMVIFHDVGKRKALETNNGKNMAKHDVYSSEWFAEWANKFNLFADGIASTAKLRWDGEWIIENHMLAHHLADSSSVYRVMDVVTNECFPRLARLATADSLATLAEDGTPHWPFSDVLSDPKVARWVGKPRPLPIVDRDDFIDLDVPRQAIYDMVEFGLRLQLNNHTTDRARIINEVMSCDKIKKLIKDCRAQEALDEVIRWNQPSK